MEPIGSYPTLHTRLPNSIRKIIETSYGTLKSCTEELHKNLPSSFGLEFHLTSQMLKNRPWGDGREGMPQCMGKDTWKEGRKGERSLWDLKINTMKMVVVLWWCKLVLG